MTQRHHSSWHSTEVKHSSQTPMCIYIFFFYHFLPSFLTPFLTFPLAEWCILCHSCSGRTSVCPETHQSQHASLLPNSRYVSFSYTAVELFADQSPLSNLQHRERMYTQTEPCNDTDTHLNAY